MDDEEMFRDMARNLFSQIGCELGLAEEGSEANDPVVLGFKEYGFSGVLLKPCGGHERQRLYALDLSS